MKYKFKKRLICEFATYMYKRKKKTIILKATDISTVQMLKCIGSFYWLYNTMNIQYMYMLRFNIVRCVFLLFYVLMKHIILYVWIQWCNKTTQILLPPPPSCGGQGLQIKSFLSGKRGRGKKEVAATVLIKTIKYYESTKYTLKKVIN
jgi:hypothetical protein